MNTADAQRDLRRAYVGGGPGAIVSALVWFAAAFVEARHGIGPAFNVLFLGGILIYPVGTLLCRFLFRRDKEAAGNPLGMTALECTIAMIGCLLAAWLFIPVMPAHVFPVAAIAVGTHYLVFKTVYGDPLYLILAAAITAVGLVSIFKTVTIPGGPILAVGLIELTFGSILTRRAMRTD